MDVVFVKTRWHYQSYTDYWRMVELCGCPTCYVDEVDVEAEAVYIVCPLNGEWEPMLRARQSEGKKRRATLISWTLEPPVKNDYLPNLRQTVDDGLVDWIWIGYRNLAVAADHPRIKFAPVGSMAALGNEFMGERQYDVAHLSYPTHRRRVLYDALRGKGVRIAPNGWGQERDATLRSSRFLLNIHKDDGFQAYEPLRFAVAAAYGLPIISESCADPHPYRPMVDYYETSYDAAIKSTLAALSQDYGQWAALGQRMRERMTGELAFDKCVEEAVCRL